MRLAACLVLAFAAPALAQGAEDPRFKTFDYNAGALFHVPTSPQTQQLLVLEPGEQVRTVLLSNPAAYQVTVSAGADSVGFKANSLAALAVMTVRTNRREYDIELAPGPGDPAKVPLVVRFASASAPAQRITAPPPPPVLLPQAHYSFKGSKVLRPASIGDDGAKTYITWADSQPVPAVFAIGPAGKEEMVEGYYRAGRYTIDRVYDQLVFKIDREVTRVRRTLGEGGKP